MRRALCLAMACAFTLTSFPPPSAWAQTTDTLRGRAARQDGQTPDRLEASLGVSPGTSSPAIPPRDAEGNEEPHHFQAEVRMDSARYAADRQSRRGELIDRDEIRDQVAEEVEAAIQSGDGEASQRLKWSVRGVQVLVDPRLAALFEEHLGASEDARGALLKHALDRLRAENSQYILRLRRRREPLVLAYLDASTHLFEDHLANGLIGINGDLFDPPNGAQPLSTVDLRINLLVGFTHELRHEGLGTSSPWRHGFEEEAFTREDIAFAVKRLEDAGRSLSAYRLALEFFTAGGTYLQQLRGAERTELGAIHQRRMQPLGSNLNAVQIATRWFILVDRSSLMIRTDDLDRVENLRASAEREWQLQRADDLEQAKEAKARAARLWERRAAITKAVRKEVRRVPSDEQLQDVVDLLGSAAEPSVVERPEEKAPAPFEDRIQWFTAGAFNDPELGRIYVIGHSFKFTDVEDARQGVTLELLAGQFSPEVMQKTIVDRRTALALNVIEFLRRQEREPSTPNDLVDEYLLRFILERTSLLSDEILRVTDTFFGRNGQDALTPLLRTFIDTELQTIELEDEEVEQPEPILEGTVAELGWQGIRRIREFLKVLGRLTLMGLQSINLELLVPLLGLSALGLTLGMPDLSGDSGETFRAIGPFWPLVGLWASLDGKKQVAGQAQAEPLDINTTSAEKLVALFEKFSILEQPRQRRRLVERILKLREEQPFTSFQDLEDRVPGIGGGVRSQMEEQLADRLVFAAPREGRPSPGGAAGIDPPDEGPPSIPEPSRLPVEIPRPERSYPPDQERLQRWVEWVGQESGPEARRAAEQIAAELTHVSQEVFERKLSEVTQALNRVLRDYPSYAVLWDEASHKSRRWVYQLAEPHLDSLPVVGVYRTLKGFQMLESIPALVIFDDASFSAEQLGQTLFFLGQERLYPEIIIAAPYLSTAAEEVIERYRREGSRIRLLQDERGQPLYERMPIVYETAAYAEINRHPLVFEDFSASASLFYFDHHLPDGFSFPDGLRSVLGLYAVPEPYRTESPYYEQEEREFREGGVVIDAEAYAQAKQRPSVDELPLVQDVIFAQLLRLDVEHDAYHQLIGERPEAQLGALEAAFRGYRVRAAFYDNILLRLKQHAGPLIGKQVLEIAPGAGVFLLALRDLGLEADGLEVNPALVKLAREHAGLQLTQGDILKPPAELLEHPYDVTFSRNLLDVVIVEGELSKQSAEAVQEALRGAARLTKPGGLSVHQIPREIQLSEEAVRVAGFEVLEDVVKDPSLEPVGYQRLLVLRRVEEMADAASAGKAPAGAADNEPLDHQGPVELPRKRQVIRDLLRGEPLPRPDPLIMQQLIRSEGLTADDILEVAAELGYEAPIMEKTLIELNNLTPYLYRMAQHLQEEFSEDRLLLLGRDTEQLHDVIKLLWTQWGDEKQVELLPASIPFWRDRLPGLYEAFPDDHVEEQNVLRRFNISEETFGEEGRSHDEEDRRLNAEWLESVGITREAIERGERFVLIDTGFQGSAALAAVLLVAKTYGYEFTDPKLRAAFPIRLVSHLGATNNGVEQLMTFRLPEGVWRFEDQRAQFPKSWRVNWEMGDPTMTTDVTVLLGIAFQLFPRSHGPYGTLGRRGGQVMAIPERQSEVRVNVDEAVSINDSIVNPVAALLVQHDLTTRVMRDLDDGVLQVAEGRVAYTWPKASTLTAETIDEDNAKFLEADIEQRLRLLDDLAHRTDEHSRFLAADLRQKIIDLRVEMGSAQTAGESLEDAGRISGRIERYRSYYAGVLSDPSQVREILTDAIDDGEEAEAIRQWARAKNPLVYATLAAQRALIYEDLGSLQEQARSVEAARRFYLTALVGLDDILKVLAPEANQRPAVEAQRRRVQERIAALDEKQTPPAGAEDRLPLDADRGETGSEGTDTTEESPQALQALAARLADFDIPTFNEPLEAITWLRTLRTQQPDFSYSLSYLMLALWTGDKIPAAQQEAWQRTAAAADFYDQHPALHALAPFTDVRAAVAWLRAHRAALGDNSLSYLMQVLWTGDKIPAAQLAAWQRTAGAADFYDQHPVLHALAPFTDVQAAVAWLRAHRAALGDNSLSYLMQVLWTGDKIPVAHQEAWQRTAAAADYALTREPIIREALTALWQEFSSEQHRALLTDPLPRGVPARVLRSLQAQRVFVRLADAEKPPAQQRVLSDLYARSILRFALDFYGRELFAQLAAADRPPPAGAADNEPLDAGPPARLEPVEIRIKQWVASGRGHLTIDADDGARFELQYTEEDADDRFFGKRQRLTVLHEGNEIGYAHFRIHGKTARMYLSFDDDAFHYRRMFFERYPEATSTDFDEAEFGSAPAEGHQEAIRVVATYRRGYRGIGTSLMGLALRLAQANGVERFESIDVSPRAFFEGLGFESFRSHTTGGGRKVTDYELPLTDELMAEQGVQLPTLSIQRRRPDQPLTIGSGTWADAPGKLPDEPQRSQEGGPEWFEEEPPPIGVAADNESLDEGPPSPREPTAQPGPEVLTPRQRQVLELVARGLSHADVGETLAISARTVDRHMNGLRARLEIPPEITRTVFAAMIQRNGWSEEPSAELVVAVTNTIRQFSPAQREVFSHAVKGLARAEIAAARGISDRTLNRHINEINRRLRRSPVAAFSDYRVDFWLAAGIAGRMGIQVTEREDLAQLTSPLTPRLTPRQIEVVNLLAKRRTTQQIAETLFIVPKTVYRNITSIRRRLGVSGPSGRGLLLTHLYRKGWVKELPPPDLVRAIRATVGELSTAEREVFERAMEGLSRSQIATARGTAKDAVSRHIWSINIHLSNSPVVEFPDYDVDFWLAAAMLAPTEAAERWNWLAGEMEQYERLMTFSEEQDAWLKDASQPILMVVDLDQLTQGPLLSLQLDAMARHQYFATQGGAVHLVLVDSTTPLQIEAELTLKDKLAAVDAAHEWSTWLSQHDMVSAVIAGQGKSAEELTKAIMEADLLAPVAPPIVVGDALPASFAERLAEVLTESDNPLTPFLLVPTPVTTLTEEQADQLRTFHEVASSG